MKIPATLFWSTDRRAFNPGKDKIEGRQAAGASFLEGFIRYSGRKNFYVTSPQINESQQFAATVGSLTDGTGKIVHVPFSAIHKAAEPGLVYRPDPLIGDQAWRRRRFGQRLFSLCGVALAQLAVLTLQGLHAVPFLGRGAVAKTLFTLGPTYPFAHDHPSPKLGHSSFLQQRCVFGVFPRFRTRAAHICQIKDGCVRAPHETHEVRGGKKYATVEIPHNHSKACVTWLSEGIASTDRKVLNNL